MTQRMRMAFFGSSLLSSYQNSAAIYYRGLLRALHRRGHRITFYEPESHERHQYRDLIDPPWTRVVVYPDDEDGIRRAVEGARGFDLVVKTSEPGRFDALLEAAVLDLQGPDTFVAFWDMDVAWTLEHLAHHTLDARRDLIQTYDLILTYGGGNPIVQAYAGLGAQHCIPIYNALDPVTHYPVSPQSRFEADLGFISNYLPDQETDPEAFFLQPAAQLPQRKFLLVGKGWNDVFLPANVNYLRQIPTHEHNIVNGSAQAVLSLSQAQWGFMPSTQLFEAAGASACVISNAWDGLELFLEPGREVLVAHNGEEVIEHLHTLTPEQARALGTAAYWRVVAEHTYAHRAAQFEEVLEGKVVI